MKSTQRTANKDHHNYSVIKKEMASEKNEKLPQICKLVEHLSPKNITLQ